MTEQEAGEALELALTNWLKATGASGDGDLVVGWVLLTEQVNHDGPGENGTLGQVQLASVKYEGEPGA